VPGKSWQVVPSNWIKQASRSHEPIHYEVIDRPAAFESALRRLHGATPLALDMEMENQRHHYGLHMALIQISSPQGKNYIFDPLSGLDLRPWAGSWATRTLNSSCTMPISTGAPVTGVYGWKLTHVFDTKIAAQLCGLRQFGLASLLQSC